MKTHVYPITKHSLSILAKRQSAAGFSLLELLVTIGIILILVSLLLPSLAGAKVTAQRARCVSNLKQLGAAWAMYSHENEGKLVSCAPYTQPGTPNSNAWVMGASAPGNIAVYGQVDAGVLDCTNRNGLARARLFPYLKAFDVYRCPSDKRTQGGVSYVRTYAMNGFMNGMRLAWMEGYRLFLKESEVPAPADLFVFIDNDEATINDAMFVVNLGSAKGMVDVPARRHRFVCPISFVDGHAESFTLVDNDTRTWVWSPSQRVVPEVNSQGETNLDLAKMRAMATVRE